MTIKTIVSVAVLSGLVFSAKTDTALANNVQSFKPIQGLSFDAGTKRAVAYFTNKAGQCQLVITLAGEPVWNTGSLEITRYVASIPPGRSERYENSGRAFQFGCANDAQAMTFQALTSVADTRK
jgi:hypothetical protein